MGVGQHPVDQQTDGDEVAIGEVERDLAHIIGDLLAHAPDQLADRHGGNDVVAVDVDVLPGGEIADVHRADFAVLQIEAAHLVAEVDFSASCLHHPGDGFPHLTGAEFRVQELLDQRGIRFFLAHIVIALEQFAKRVEYGFADVQALDALRAPFGADFLAGHAPDLFRVVLEKSQIELAAEAVDEEVFQAFSGLRGNSRAQA